MEWVGLNPTYFLLYYDIKNPHTKPLGENVITNNICFI